MLQELARQGLAEAGRGWIQANEDIVKMNEAQSEWEAATGRLGEALAPAATALVSFGADAVEFVTGLIIDASAAIQDFIGWFEKMSGKVDEVDEWSGAPTWGVSEDAIRTATANELAAANTGTKPAASASDVQNAAMAASYASRGETRRGGTEYIGTVSINIDGREVAKATQPYLREEDSANPEVVSDLL